MNDNPEYIEHEDDDFSRNELDEESKLPALNPDKSNESSSLVEMKQQSMSLK